MKMACEYCEMIQGKKEAAKIYEDGRVVAFLSPQPASIGHIVVVPKKHLPILEALGDDDVAYAFSIANKISISVFEALKIEGTNIIVHNGVAAGQEEPHFSINIVPRKSDDGLVMEWSPSQLSDEEMATIELQLKEEMEKRQEPVEVPVEAPQEDAGTGDKPAEAEAEPAKEGTSEEKKEKEENYLIKQLKRMP